MPAVPRTATGAAQRDRPQAGPGSEAGFEAAFRTWYAPMVRMVEGMLHDRPAAEEVVQEAYLDAWRSSSRYEPSRGSALGWLLTIVHRKAVDRVRSAEEPGEDGGPPVRRRRPPRS